MSTAAIVIIVLIVLYVAGQVLALRPNPQEQQLGQLRSKARRMGLHPRLIAYPTWLAEQLKDNMHQPKHGMVAYYSVIVDNAQIPLMHALVANSQINVLQGNTALQHEPMVLTGAIALDMQANAVGLYWDETQDLQGDKLQQMYDTLIAFAQPYIR